MLYITIIAVALALLILYAILKTSSWCSRQEECPRCLELGGYALCGGRLAWESCPEYVLEGIKEVMGL